MKITCSNPALDDEDDLAAEYAFDYSNAKDNLCLDLLQTLRANTIS